MLKVRFLVLSFTLFISAYHNAFSESQDYPLAAINDFILSRDRTVAASAHDDYTINIWDTSTGRILNTFQSDVPDPEISSEFYFGISAITFNPDHSLLAVGYLSEIEHEQIDIYNVSTGQRVMEIPSNSSIISMDWSYDGSKLIVGAINTWERDNRFDYIQIWDVTSSTLVNESSIEDYVSEIQWHPNNVQYAYGNASSLKVIDSTNNQFVANLVTEASYFYAIDWNVDGTYLAAAGGSTAISIIDAYTGQVQSSFNKQVLDAVTLGVRWSPDSQYLGVLSATTGARTVEIWNVETGNYSTVILPSTVLRFDWLSKDKIVFVDEFSGLQVFSIPGMAHTTPPSETSDNAQFVKRLAVQQINDVSFYYVDTMGQLERIDALSDAFVLDGALAEWWATRGAALSPDGQHIVVPAYHYDEQNRDESSFFLYTSGQPELIRIPLRGIGEIRWSPDSQTVLIAPPELGFYDPALELVDGIYRYDLQSDTLLALTNTPEVIDHETDVTWLPDNEHIVYVGDRTTCEISCTRSVRDLYLISLNNPTPVRLTHLDGQIPPDSDMPYFLCRPQQLRWSAQRLYYAVHCIDDADHGHDFLYSVSLEGDNRLEANLPALYPTDRNSRIVDIQPTSAGVYLTVEGDTEPSPDEPILSNNWRVLRVDQPEDIESIFTAEYHFGDSLIDAGVSPDSRLIALVGGYGDEGHVRVIDLETGEIVLERTTPHPVCELQWLDFSHLIYTEYVQPFCSQPGGTWKLDVETNTITEITAGLEGMVWVLPAP